MPFLWYVIVDYKWPKDRIIWSFKFQREKYFAVYFKASLYIENKHQCNFKIKGKYVVCWYLFLTLKLFYQHWCSIHVCSCCILWIPRITPGCWEPRTVEIGIMTTIEPPAPLVAICTVTRNLVIVDIEGTKLHSCQPETATI